MRRLVLLLVVPLLITGCELVPPNTFVITPKSLERRQLETRRYDGIKEKDLLVACANLLQDLGYTLENSEAELGVLTASKKRSAVNAAAIAANFLSAIVLGQTYPHAQDQTIRASLAVRPAGASGGNSSDSHLVRVTFQRIVRMSDNSLIYSSVSNKKLYPEFYDKLSKSIFLEAHEL